ncbi:MAG: hypothetical protein JNK02_16825 [Planctomycetes bacterium]|nr:hypothetical protein [Planctomycetota bacterium]
MRRVPGVVVLAGLLALASCGSSDPNRPQRVVARTSASASVLPPRPHGASIEERFGLAPRAPQPDAGVGEAVAMLRWDLPPGWVEREPSSMRIANFLASGDERAECYLTILAGDGGGLGANVNRWLGQLGRPALASAQIDALPRGRLFGREAVLLDAQGAFTGMSGGAPRPDTRLLGLLLVDPDGSAFLKFTGPAQVVARERDAFLTLAASFRSAADRAAGGAAAPPAADVATSEALREERAAGLLARVPEPWMRVAAKPPRALDLRVDADVECSLTVLPGAAGGARANIDRWRAQLGLGPLDEAQFAGLEQVEMLGARALLVEASSGEAGLLGVVASSSDRSVFVKLTGPVGLLARHRAAFLELCRTLEEG